jgi:hypothetical protein
VKTGHPVRVVRISPSAFVVHPEAAVRTQLDGLFSQAMTACAFIVRVDFVRIMLALRCETNTDITCHGL